MEALRIIAIVFTFLGFYCLVGVITLFLLERSRLWAEGGLATGLAYLAIALTVGCLGGLVATIKLFT